MEQGVNRRGQIKSEPLSHPRHQHPPSSDWIGRGCATLALSTIVHPRIDIITLLRGKG